MRTLGLMLLLLVGATLGALGEVDTTQNRTLRDSQSRQPLDASALRGREIYHQGTSASGPPIKLVLSSSDFEMDAKYFPCANCHGTNGEGSAEGGVEPPPIRWRELSRPSQSPLTQRRRPAHDEGSLERAIVEGLDPTGEPLHPGMPRYRLTSDQITDLVSYLRILDTEHDLDQGLTPDSILLGAFLPLSGERSGAGHSIEQSLRVYASEVNRRGGIFGRRIEFAIRDCGDTPGGALAAAQSLIEPDGVFAIIASTPPLDSKAIQSLVAEHGVPWIGPLTIPSKPEELPNRYVFHLLSSNYDQARVLVESIALYPELPRSGWSIITLDDRIHQEARAGAQRQMEIFDQELRLDLTYEAGNFDPIAVVRQLEERGTRGVFIFGASADISEFAQIMEQEKKEWPLLTTGSTLGRMVFQLPTSVANNTYMTYPGSQPRERDLRWLFELVRDTDIELDRPSQQGPALAAFSIFLEGAKRSGRRLGTEVLISALESIEDFSTGLVPPVSYGLNQRTGALGSYLLRVNLDRQALIPGDTWITPRNDQ